MSSEKTALELPPISNTAPRRMLVFLHGAGSSPEEFATIARRWQLKFPGAQAVLLRGLLAARFDGQRDWFDGCGVEADRLAGIARAVSVTAERIAMLQRSRALTPAQTVLIGFSQGATLALELARQRPESTAIVVGYATRLVRPIAADERVNATIHLIHGELDSWVPAVHAERALRGLRAIGADATLDIAGGAGHSINREMISIGTTRVMQTVFRGRRPMAAAVGARPTLH
jgi:phospholipase/carboxylesterase